MIDAALLKSMMLTCYLSLLISSILFASLHELYWSALFLNIISTAWVIYLVYLNENFLYFVCTMIFYFVTFVSQFSGISFYFLYLDWFGEQRFFARLASFVPMIFFFGFLTLSYFSKIRSQVFVFDENKVRVLRREEVGRPLASGAILGGGGALLAQATSKVMDAEFSIALASIILLVFGVYMLTRLRNVMANLRVLRLKERKTGVSYVFIEIDDIRQARNRWWIPRFLKWLSSLRHAFS